MDIEQLAGSRLGNYEIESLLGRGGMGVVFKARQISLNRSVALKILPPMLSSNSSFVKRFQREAQAVAQLDHPNIVQIFDTAEAQGLHFFSMQYIEGRTLDEVLKESGRLDADKAVKIITQAAQGIEHAHNNGIIHRDIKPSNIILEDSGNVRVMDFGLARAADDHSKVTQSGTLIGTLSYMSPEQCRGERLDLRTDIYSLGIVLFEMLTGQGPFEGDSAPDIIFKIVYEDPVDAVSLNPEVPLGLSRVITRAIAKDRDKRYANISEFLREIGRSQNLESGEPTPGKEFRGTKPMTMPATEDAEEFSADLETVQVGASNQTGGSSPSIAVLPFVNMSADPEQEYFCDGLSEELINGLTHIQDLKVIARTSAFSFKGKNVDIRDIGRELDVGMILEGSVRKAGNKVRITAQLIDTVKGHHLWSERYDRPMDDIFAIQDEMTQVIVDILKPTLMGGEKERLIKRQQVNLDAYRLYLKGRWFWDKLTEKSLMKAVEFFELAIEKDAGYAPAYAGLADSYCTFPLTSLIPPKQVYPKAKNAALKAIEIDDTLAEAHASLAHILFRYDWDWQAAEEEYKRAVALNPGSASAHYWYSSFLKYMARSEESLREITRALELDPLSLQKNTDAALALCYADKSDQAIEFAQKTIDMDPNYSYAHLVLAYIYLRGLLIDEALVEFEKSRSLSESGNPAGECGIGIIYVLKGKTDEAREMLDSFITQAEEYYFPPYYIAALDFVLGNVDEGFSWLEKAYEERDYFLINLRTERTLVGLGLDSDPRYIALLRKMNIDP